MLERLKNMRASLDLQRRHSNDTLQLCSAAIRGFYQRIDTKELSQHIKVRLLPSPSPNKNMRLIISLT